MNAAGQRRLTPWLMVTAIALGGLLLLLLLGTGAGVHWDAARPRAPLPPAGNPANLPQPIPLQQFALVWQKPLFSPDRKPVSAAADGGSQLGDLELTGVILTPSLHMALLHDRQANREVRLREGQSLPDGSVTLLEVRARSAIFDASGGRSELKLPAGAPIDMVAARAKSDAVDPEQGGPVMQPLPPPPPRADPAARRESPAERLRQNIQKRRAERAAAATEGVR
ncbi:general secretion pathway protein GspN [Rhodanobacter sp. AS-Z3]|uniref:general secretion pathway protein GspN n=1 Tax=Rhodanobacter sp. AS-Z3 TaxID=3031330 RepID=UPI002478D9D4|nr:general secretion pathway protein GspN [Rhodanobacter sp. AS-Z3]WEN15297.1 general secretion pathway protein GspN [Rhodanobacter sp. AS-Z3]